VRVWASEIHVASSAGSCSGRTTDDVVEVVEDVADVDVDVDVALVAGVDDELQAGTKASSATAPINSPAVAPKRLRCDVAT
jgi:hypothetical protein